MVALGIEAEEGDPEPVLAPGGTVATAGVAAGPHEDRHHVEPEAERRDGRRLSHLDRDLDRLAPEGDVERRLAVEHRMQDGPIAADQRGVGRRHDGLGRDVASDPVGEGRLDDQRLAVPGGREVDVVGEDLKLAQGRFTRE